jgi:hypothetical protein
LAVRIGDSSPLTDFDLFVVVLPSSEVVVAAVSESKLTDERED